MDHFIFQEIFITIWLSKKESISTRISQIWHPLFPELSFQNQMMLFSCIINEPFASCIYFSISFCAFILAFQTSMHCLCASMKALHVSSGGGLSEPSSGLLALRQLSRITLEGLHLQQAPWQHFFLGGAAVGAGL